MNNRLQANGRSGHYIRQATGYSAFSPRALPPAEPILDIDDEMRALLSKADRALGRLDGSIQTLPNPDLFVLMYIRKEAVLSSQIEGTQSSLADVLEAEANLANINRPRDVGEVINYVSALNHGLSRLDELPLSTRLIREIHERLLRGVRGQERNPGETRATQNWIGPGGSNLNNAIFVPPPPHEVASALSDLEHFIHADDHIPALIKIGLVHAQFETIHPFLDGNGRVGRLLITFFLCEREILIKPVLYISHYFRQHRQRYYELLQGTRDDGLWEAWVKFFLEGISTVSQEATETAREIVGLRERYRLHILTTFGRAAGNGLTLLENLFEKPIINVNQVATLLGMTHAGANQLVRRMVDANILIEMTGQSRNRAFRFSEYLDLF